MLDRFPAKGQITTSEIEDWHRDLTPFSVEAIDFAFEKMRAGIFFPMNGQVLELCMSYDPPDAPRKRTNENCDAICRARHGKGYGEADIQYLMRRIVGDKPFYFENGNARRVTELVQAQALAGANSGKVIVFHAGSFDVADIESLLADLDEARGGSPEWRVLSE